MTAIIGGLGAAFLWASATVASSRSSRMIGSRVVLAWVMIVGTIVGLPLALASGIPTDIPPDAPLLMLVAGLAYSAGLYVAYRALAVGKVSIVAPIVATEGAIAAVLAVALGDTLGLSAALLLGSHRRRCRPVVDRAGPTGRAGRDIEIAADALDGPPGTGPAAAVADPGVDHTREASSSRSCRRRSSRSASSPAARRRSSCRRSGSP